MSFSQKSILFIEFYLIMHYTIFVYLCQKGAIMSKHTPGPWMIDHRTSRDLLSVYAKPAPNKMWKTIAQYEPNEVGPHSEENIANAALIAAAPELLETLIQINAAINLREMSAEQLLTEIVVLIRPLIAKAKGEL